MGDTLILASINGRILTNKLVDSWLNSNEKFITNKTFSNDQYSVEITFIDDDRADLMCDLLTTCYSDYITVSRPQTLISSFNNSDEEGGEERTEREPSPIHLSSALSTSSRVTCFSQRLAQLDKKQNDKNVKPILGHGRINQNQFSSAREINNDKQNSIIDSDTISSIHSIDDNISSVFGRGRGSIYK